MGVSRDTFYRYQAAVADGGVEILLDANRTQSATLPTDPHEPKPVGKKIPTPKGWYVRYWWWGGDRLKRLVVQEVSGADNTCEVQGITAEKQVIFDFSDLEYRTLDD